ncbi:cobalamin-dependent protein [Limibacillus halophilus]
MTGLQNPLAGEELPDGRALVEEGKGLASVHRLGPSPFLSEYGVACEIDYKRQAAAEGRIMQHAQIGYRDPARSREAWRDIAQALTRAGGRVDRYGICLDWSMGYPAAERAARGKGTGLILERPEDFSALTASGPVAPHFGDFVIGLPAALENTAAALAAGATAIGNLGQYFTFRLPNWPEDQETTRASLLALSLCAAQPVPVLIHSNLDDGFAALFTDLACAFGAVLLERYIVEELVGGVIGHCYGHTFSDPLTRLAFQRALASGRETPGTMVYGNTTLYREGAPAAVNYAQLGSYLSLDMAAQLLMPSGHAVTPIPVSEADRIPDIDEVVDAQLFAQSLAGRMGELLPLYAVAEADRLTERLLAGGELFKEQVLAGLSSAGVDCGDPYDLLLALRRVGAKRLEELYGPGEPDESTTRGRQPLIEASPVAELNRRAEQVAQALDDAGRERLAAAGLVVCVASSDVHEYGKLLVEQSLRRAGVEALDAGVHADPDKLVRLAREGCAAAIAISTYNGVALDYLAAVRRELEAAGLTIPVFIGGKLNQIPPDSNSALPVDVTRELRGLGAEPCRSVEEMLLALARGLEKSA